MSPRTACSRRCTHQITFQMALILAFTSGCGFMSGPSEYEKYMNREKSFEKLVASAGGNAKKEGKAMHGFKMVGWIIDLSGAELTDKLISQIIEVAQNEAIFDLNLSNTSITDDQLAELDAGSVLQKTVNLNLAQTGITDAGLDSLSNFYCLTSLNLKGSKATQEAGKRMGEKKSANPQTPAPFKVQPKVEI